MEGNFHCSSRHDAHGGEIEFQFEQPCLRDGNDLIVLLVLAVADDMFGPVMVADRAQQHDLGTARATQLHARRERDFKLEPVVARRNLHWRRGDAL
ncbi:MAG: hypothetical protein EB082_16295, partial [Verrucomicrobia bacterium]|nr:hypothetical protein [Verrucomicrobiota bacterium]